ncbi:hypothetical protein CEXT_442111 [Caerostris extrusa]|uniref:Uncharacterized protein n=1 Tax=Caerostris extrusa TaxID=172846 RepID=A0AAV4TG07_CAEEX|nr:hypothetical protein CEXT_442111 [Caerostris extrusa]
MIFLDGRFIAWPSCIFLIYDPIILAIPPAIPNPGYASEKSSHVALIRNLFERQCVKKNRHIGSRQIVVACKSEDQILP